MERLEAKQIKGHTYYYYSKWEWVDGRCRRVWQKYLGTLAKIVRAVEGGGPAPQYAEIFQWGLPTALWQECSQLDVVDRIDRRCHKRRQGLSTGQYLAVAAVNRAMSPKSKRSMWDWFSQTALLRHLPQASRASLTSQRFWDHMDRIDGQAASDIWKDILQDVVRREQLDLSSVSYDGTNFYTFIDTFNTRCEIARRGKNKQGRNNLRQISYALFCCADGQLPLFYDVYEGNRNDAKQFPRMLDRFAAFFQELSGGDMPVPETTLVFDKGNNSADNFRLLDSLPLRFVGSVKLDEHKDLAKVLNHDPRFQTTADHPDGTKSFRVKKQLYGRERVLVVTYNQNLFHTQWLTLQNDIRQAIDRLASLQQRLEDRSNGLIKGGRTPSVQSVKSQSQTILKRQHLKTVISASVKLGSNNVPRLEYAIDAEALHELSETYLGKNLLITDRDDWDDPQIIRAYRSQFLIEDVFKQTKDRDTGSWWPLHHWTDSKIKVHALYCSIALLLRALMLRRVRGAGLHISMKRLLGELDAIREVVNIYPRSGNQKVERKQTVLTKTSQLQEQLTATLGIERARMDALG
jgi:transposase